MKKQIQTVMSWKNHWRVRKWGKYLLVCMLVMMVSLTCDALRAQNTPKFINHKLEEIASQLLETYHVNCGDGQLSKLKERQLVVTTDSFHVINHIGFQFFNRSIVEQNPSPVYNFVERFLLELFLMKDNSAITEYLRENKVNLHFGQKDNKGIYSNLLWVLSNVTSDLSMIITTDNNRYSLSWFQNNRSIFSLRFPIRYELLWGMNKSESENRFYTDLLAFRSTRVSSDSFDSFNLSSLKAIGDSCFCMPGDFYGIGAIASDQYYRKTVTGDYVQLSDSQYPAESILNLFTMKVDKRMVASVVQRMYGGKKRNFDIALSQLLDFCKMNGCEVYAGIESQEKNLITGVVVLVNRSLGYNHLLSFSTDCAILEQPDKHKMNIQLYTFVPVHNVNTLYNEQTIKKREK